MKHENENEVRFSHINLYNEAGTAIERQWAVTDGKLEPVPVPLETKGRVSAWEERDILSSWNLILRGPKMY